MEEISLKSWSEFEVEVAKIQAANKRQLLFRGLRKADYALSTTLERIADAPCDVAEYYSHIIGIKPEIEAFTSSQWKAPKVRNIPKFASVETSFSQLLNGGKPLAYSYMATCAIMASPRPYLIGPCHHTSQRTLRSANRARHESRSTRSRSGLMAAKREVPMSLRFTALARHHAGTNDTSINSRNIPFASNGTPRADGSTCHMNHLSTRPAPPRNLDRTCSTRSPSPGRSEKRF